MTTAMDLYLNINDSSSLQDMLDLDIKSEVDALLGGHNDLSGFNFTDLPPLEFEDNEICFISSNSNHSNGSFLDFSDELSTMVNPNAVMPISLAQNIRSPSPQLKRSHLTFSPCSIKISGFKSSAATKLKKDLLDKLGSVEDKKPIAKTLKTKSLVMLKPVTKSNPTILTFKNAVQHNISSGNITRTINNVKIYTHNNRKQAANNRIVNHNEPSYPKPAYSYSCLIAMALKNSCTGSLPVSEIYNFMSRHFPYFKTAPSGWKNSVRHNLSLNKCFEKIEKPPINGAQRKGCLWAMNPTKIIKMDEEVQKWSRKDTNAIRRAMTNPENLEYLERGDLKFTYEDADTFGDSCGSAESEEESEPEIDIDMNNHYIGNQRGYIDINTIKMETKLNMEDETLYDEINIEDDKEVLRVEMALAKKELLQFESTRTNKRRKLYIIQN